MARLLGGARVIPAANRHCTVAFLGAVAEERVAAIEEVVAASRVAGPVHSCFTEVGGFPSLRRARVLWAGLADPHARLAGLVSQVRRGLAHMGFEPEARPFSAHVTLARLPDPAGVDPGDLPALDPEPFAMEHLTLFESRLSTAGARYTPRRRVSLS